MGTNSYRIILYINLFTTFIQVVGTFSHRFVYYKEGVLGCSDFFFSFFKIRNATTRQKKFDTKHNKHFL